MSMKVWSGCEITVTHNERRNAWWQNNHDKCFSDYDRKTISFWNAAGQYIYEALSYAWGDAECTELLQVGISTIPLTASLFS
jgi:hypothetical protein